MHNNKFNEQQMLNKIELDYGKKTHEMRNLYASADQFIFFIPHPVRSSNNKKKV